MRFEGFDHRGSEGVGWGIVEVLASGLGGDVLCFSCDLVGLAGSSRAGVG